MKLFLKALLTWVVTTGLIIMTIQVTHPEFFISLTKTVPKEKLVCYSRFPRFVKAKGGYRPERLDPNVSILICPKVEKDESNSLQH